MKTTQTHSVKGSPLSQTRAFERLRVKLRAKHSDERLRKLAFNFLPNVNLNELVASTGLGKSTLCRILRGSRHKNTYTLLLVATALNIGLEDFVYILELRKNEADRVKAKTKTAKKVIFHGE